MNSNWSELRPLSKLDQLAETIMKTAFLLSTSVAAENHHVILCRLINIEKTNYAFVSKSDLERGLRDDLWIGLVLFVDGQKPTKYLFPSTAWNEPNQLFSDSAVQNPEYGINLNKNTIMQLQESFSFEHQINKL